MTVSEPSYDDVIAGFYRSAMGDEEWPAALGRMSQYLGILGSQFVCVDHTTGALTSSHACETLPAEGEIDYVRNFFSVDPRIPLLLGREPGRWLYCQDEFDEARVEREPFYQGLLIPYGGRYSASMKAAHTEHETVLFASLTRLDRGPFDKDQQAELERMSRHLVQSITAYRRNRWMRRTAFVGAELIERISRPVFVLSLDRIVEAQNGAARRMLSTDASPFRVVEGRLQALAAPVQQALTVEIMRLGHGVDAKTDDRFIRLEGRSEREWLAASVALMDPQKTMQAFGERQALLVTVHPRESSKRPDAWMLQSALGLTRAEARVAAEIYMGASLPEAARRMGIKPSTAKTHLQAVFEKHHLERQTDLVRLVGSLMR